MHVVLVFHCNIAPPGEQGRSSTPRVCRKTTLMTRGEQNVENFESYVTNLYVFFFIYLFIYNIELKI